MPTKERKRQEAIFELISTEAAYVRDLQLIVEVGLFTAKLWRRLTCSHYQVFYTNLIPILDQKAVTVIFANVEDILLTNTVNEVIPSFPIRSLTWIW